jgi:hypothetical protein
MLSYIGALVERGDEDRMTESGGDPEMMATRFRMSVARRLDCEFTNALRLALEVVIRGSVAATLSSLGLRPLTLLGDESLLALRRESGDEAMIDVWCMCLFGERLLENACWRMTGVVEIGDGKVGLSLLLVGDGAFLLWM